MIAIIKQYSGMKVLLHMAGKSFYSPKIRFAYGGRQLSFHGDEARIGFQHIAHLVLVHIAIIVKAHIRIAPADCL